MTVLAKVLVPAKSAENVQTTQYTSANSLSIIDKFTVTNISGANATFSCNLVTVSGSAGATNLILATRSIVPNECYTCPELVGQVLGSGDFISTIAGTANALTMRVSGRQIT